MVRNLDMWFGPGALSAGAKARLHTAKAVTYHEQTDYCRYMIGHSFGRMESSIKKFCPHLNCVPFLIFLILFLIFNNDPSPFFFIQAVCAW